MTKFNYNEQPSFNFKSPGFDPEEEFYPGWSSDIFLDSKELRSTGDKLLGYLQGLARKLHNEEISRIDSYKTKRELAKILYPDFYKDLENNKIQLSFINDNYQYFNHIKLIEEKHINKVGEAIRSINRRVRQELNNFRSLTEKLDYLRETAELFVPVSQTQTGANLFAYHGPDFPLDIKLIEIYRELSAEHLEKQSEPKKMADKLHQALTGSEKIQLDLDIDFDDDEDLEGFESF
jgi:hypothetical protein